MVWVEIPANPLVRAFLIIACVVQLLALIALGLRLLCVRIRKTKLRRDDGFVCVSTVFGLVNTVLFCFFAYSGLGPSIEGANTDIDYEDHKKMLFIFELNYQLGTCSAKLSTLGLYLRVFAHERMQKATKASIAFILLGFLAHLFWIVLLCRPLSSMWKIGHEGDCGDRQNIYFSSCSFTIASDVLLLTLPMPVIWRLQMKRSSKMGLSCLFASGLLVAVMLTACLIISTGYGDFIYTSAYSTFFCTLEPNLASICASLPVIHNLHMTFRKKHRNSMHQPTFNGVQTIGTAETRKRHNPLEHLQDSRETFQLDTLGHPSQTLQHHTCVEIEKGLLLEPLPAILVDNQAHSSGSQTQLIHHAGHEETASLSEAIAVHGNWGV
ncbi:uncharacterized protein BCR38DRAFT_426873 [Pseudomassariella vexata]|uniref:Rhodopsin domain-containing protein n=1 Tax=Pseudomassariella vexata TaxID=1141098 RepID=A0A1Y2E772_9PEZI|nr:uncharacterized protein BCR38DRAFT_426873 [Pseudomassariella vexata]ORY67379.1 hypothetical protein BCR38DRAFT_426873 [Pseudomassariella vexata]